MGEANCYQSVPENSKSTASYMMSRFTKNWGGEGGVADRPPSLGSSEREMVRCTPVVFYVTWHWDHCANPSSTQCAVVSGRYYTEFSSHLRPTEFSGNT